MKALLQLVRKPLTTERWDASVAGIGFYASALCVFVLGTMKMTRLDLDEKELFFGVILMCCLTAQFALGGALCDVYRGLKTDREQS